MSTTTPVRQRIVDDTDPAIQYGPQGWFVADPKTLNVGNFGPIFNGTSHATSSSTSSLSFPFNGTSITVYGTIEVSTDPATDRSDPTWTCFVDGIAIDRQNPTFKFPENNWNLCDASLIAPGAHTLTIQVQSAGHPFYFDYLVYTPPPDETPESGAVIYPNTDPAVSFSPGWGTFGGENGTNSFGARVGLDFHGTSVSMLGFVPTEQPHGATWATYAIDGGPAVNFTLHGLSPGPPSQIPTAYNVVLFETPTLRNAAHSLLVTHGGDNQHTPLVLSAFHVTVAAGTDSSASLSAASASATSSMAPDAKGPPVGAVAGGVIAGAIVLAIVCALAIFHTRRRRRSLRDAVAARPYLSPIAGARARARTGAGAAPVARGQGRSQRSRPAAAAVFPRSTATVAAASSAGSGAHSTSAVVSHDGDPVSVSAPPRPQPSATATRARTAPDVRPGLGARPDVLMLRHADSGVRLHPGAAQEIVELPPGYSTF
ncbi:hypothetical protein GGX14DRAFT_673270 [Mycena pura]|uniref:Uncharacterized protein n=1 Tax=Mycena pura TaxID=153505 RepID=A0AAD6Y6F0_9AGAR|nr:hypothetical protein GGX14DRAFT_673270 [Mycena pura]